MDFRSDSIDTKLIAKLSVNAIKFETQNIKDCNENRLLSDSDVWQMKAANIKIWSNSCEELSAYTWKTVVSMHTTSAPSLQIKESIEEQTSDACRPRDPY